MVRWQFRFEPTAWSEAFRQLMILAVVMNWLPLTESQQDTVLMAGSAIIMLVNRSFVQPIDR
jgi:hypothetical protein